MVHDYVSQNYWLEDCVALLMRHGSNFTEAVELCIRIYRAYGELAAEDAYYMSR